MAVEVKLPALLRVHAGGASSVSAEGSSWPFSACAESVCQATAVISKKATTATISIVA